MLTVTSSDMFLLYIWVKLRCLQQEQLNMMAKLQTQHYVLHTIIPFQRDVSIKSDRVVCFTVSLVFFSLTLADRSWIHSIQQSTKGLKRTDKNNSEPNQTQIDCLELKDCTLQLELW